MRALLDAAANRVQNEAAQNMEADQDGGDERDGEEAGQDGDRAAAANGEASNRRELALLGELLGQYGGSQGDESSSDEEDEHDESEGMNAEQLQPARNHPYLPTAQPLFPEEWIPAGQHRHRLSRDNISIHASLLSRDAGDGDVKECAEEHSREESAQDAYKADLHQQSPCYYEIPSPGTVPHSPKGLELGDRETERATAESHLALAVMEMEDVVLFPGSVIPLRLRHPAWVNYLGKLIDDARGLYGPHQGTAGGMGEVRIVILPRISGETRRTIRRPRQSGGRTGRWRVDLIRRGVGLRRRPRRRPRSESEDTEEVGDSNTSESRTSSMNADEGSETNQRESRRTERSSADEDTEDDLFHPAAIPQVLDDDPLVGRIATMATITFTHEETTAAGDPNEADANGVPRGDQQSPRDSDRHSSSVWRNRGDELVVTALGTARVRLVRSMKDSKAAQDQQPVQIPLYAIEEIHDRSASMPPFWMLHPSGNTRCPVAPPTKPSDQDVDDNDAEEDENENDTKCSNNGMQHLTHRSSTPAIAYQKVWPLMICNKICTLIQDTEALQGLRSILGTAAGIRTVGADDDGADALAIVEDPSAFANWMCTNMPLSSNDRLDLLEMSCTVKQLRAILKKLEAKSDEAILRCKHCGSAISNIKYLFSVGGSEGTTGAYVNEHGIVHQTVTLRSVDRHTVVCVGLPETRDSWFPGYSWTIAHCAVCSDHLGWKFRRVAKGDNDPDRPKSFWGFSSITDNHVTPRRVSFRTRRARTALFNQG
ncbi:hypothetical protein ACHAXT_000411 [Thalassiosira profunda]